MHKSTPIPHATSSFLSPFFLVSEAWAAVPEETGMLSGCGIMSVLSGSEESHLPDQLADISALSPEDRFELRDECLELVFVSNSGESFSGFGSDRKCW